MPDSVIAGEIGAALGEQIAAKQCSGSLHDQKNRVPTREAGEQYRTIGRACLPRESLSPSASARGGPAQRAAQPRAAFTMVSNQVDTRAARRLVVRQHTGKRTMPPELSV